MSDPPAFLKDLLLPLAPVEPKQTPATRGVRKPKVVHSKVPLSLEAGPSTSLGNSRTGAKNKNSTRTGARRADVLPAPQASDKIFPSATEQTSGSPELPEKGSASGHR